MKRSSIITTSLLSLTSAAITPGPTVATTFPKYASEVVPTTANSFLGPAGATLGSILPLFNQQLPTTLTASVGPIRGYRNSLFAFPTQSLVKASSALAATAGTINGQTATRTFYATTPVLIGATSYAASSDGALANAPNGSFWVVCKTTVGTVDCNGGVNTDGQGTPVFNAYPGRVMMKAGYVATETAQQIGAGATDLAYQLQFNEDLALASMYHSSFDGDDVVTGAKWCSDFDNKLLTAGTMVPFAATYGLTGRNKCSWVLTAEGGTVGPAFKLKTSDFLNFYLHYVEWAGTAALAANAILPAADAAAYFLGAYAVGSNGAQHLNPLTAQGTTPALATTTNWNINALFTTSSSKDPNMYLGGSIGTIKYFPGMDGDAKEVQMFNMDQMQVKSMYDMTTKSNDQFNSDNGAYEKLRTVYEDAKTAETARLADALKAAFEPVIAIPSRPCAPSRPMAYSGVALDLGSTVAFPATAATAGTRGQLTVAYSGAGTSGSAADSALAVGSVKIGYVYPTADTSATAKAVGSAGHVFGRLGQGAMTLPGAAAPFAWFPVATASLPAMMVSAFPAADADVGLAAATNFVRLEATASVWATLDSFKAPGQPGAPTAATSENAKILALGAASALVFVTLA